MLKFFSRRYYYCFLLLLLLFFYIVPQVRFRLKSMILGWHDGKTQNTVLNDEWTGNILVSRMCFVKLFKKIRSYSQCLNFALVPLYLRTTFTGCCAFVWATFLCFSHQCGDGTLKAALNWIRQLKSEVKVQESSESKWFFECTVRKVLDPVSIYDHNCTVVL